MNNNGQFIRRLAPGGFFVPMKRLLFLLFLAAPVLAQIEGSSQESLTITSVTSGYEVGSFTDIWTAAPAGTEPAPGNRIYADTDDSFTEDSFPTGLRGGYIVLTDSTENDSNTASLFAFTTNIETQICIWFDDSVTIDTWASSYTDSGHNIIIGDQPHSGYCAIKASGVQTMGGNTDDGDGTDHQMYVVSVKPSSFQYPAVVTPGASDPGEYQFVGDWQIPEDATTNSVDVLRVNGNDGAVTVDVTDTGNGTCVDTVDYTSPSDSTRSWADNVDGNAGGHNITTLDISADCTIEWAFTNATGGITAAATKQTQITTVQANQAATATYYVDCDSGSDAANGTTTGTPWKTVQKAEDNVAPGDTVWIQGTCAATTGDNRVVNITADGTSSEKITWLGWPGQSNQIGRLPATTADQYGFVLLGADYHRFENLNFVGTEQKCLYMATDGGTTSDSGSTDIEIVGNTFTQCGRAHTSCTVDFGHNAVDASPYTDGTLIENNFFTKSGRVIDEATCEPLGNTNNHQYRHDHAVYLKGKGHIVRNNVFIDNPAGIGIKVDGYKQVLGEVVSPNYSHVIINNTFGPNTADQPYDGCSGHPIGPTNSTSSSFDPRYLVANNIFLEPIDGENGVNCTGSVLIQDVGWQNFDDTPDCHNNITTGTKVDSTCSEHISEISANVTQSNNVINETLNNLDFDGTCSTTTDATDCDIGVSSSAIGQGDCSLTDAPTTDFNGNARSATTCDMGAFEN